MIVLISIVFVWCLLYRFCLMLSLNNYLKYVYIKVSLIVKYSYWILLRYMMFLNGINLVI